MICPECVNGDHGKCKTNERWGQPSKTGLSPKSREIQKHTWCYCQHRGWPPSESPTLRVLDPAEDTELTHRPCCSSHMVDMTCTAYRRAHFVEVGTCCEAWTARWGEAVKVARETFEAVEAKREALAERERREYLDRHQDDVVPDSGVAVKAWRVRRDYA